MRTLGRRVAQAEARRPVGCATCRFWTGAIVMTADEDGTETGRSRPEQCPDCGRVVAVRHVLRIVGVDWDASRAWLVRRIDQLQAVAVARGARTTMVNWSALTDAELERLEGMAVRAAAWTDRHAFVASLDADDQAWLDAVAMKTGLVEGRGG